MRRSTKGSESGGFCVAIVATEDAATPEVREGDEEKDHEQEREQEEEKEEELKYTVSTIFFSQ